MFFYVAQQAKRKIENEQKRASNILFADTHFYEPTRRTLERDEGKSETVSLSSVVVVHFVYCVSTEANDDFNESRVTLTSTHKSYLLYFFLSSLCSRLIQHRRTNAQTQKRWK